MTELILFSASWCPPCKKFKKILPSLVKKYPSVDFSVIDVEDSIHADICADITCLPTVKIYKSGAEHKVFTRVLAELDEIEDAIGS